MSSFSTKKNIFAAFVRSHTFSRTTIRMAAVSLSDELEVKLAMNDGALDVDDDESDDEEAPGM